MTKQRQGFSRWFFVGIAGILMLGLAPSAFAIEATGGNVTNDNVAGYRVHIFTNSATASNFVVTTGGNVEVLVVAGGGGAGSSLGGGGGAGGLIYSSSVGLVSGSNYTVTVGLGGGGGAAGGANVGSKGGNSVFGTLLAYGGGGGGANGSGKVPTSGGSGGGGAALDGQTGGGGATNTQGYIGGDGLNASGNHGGGGGGGAGSMGSNGTSTAQGNGGTGTNLPQFASVAGSPAGWFAGGGSGGSYLTGATRGFGGSGGGGDGGPTGANTAGSNGVANTGGGGGSGNYTSSYLAGGAGGTGIVMVRYLYSQTLRVEATSPTTIGTTNATLNGDLVGDGGDTNTAVAFCWGYTDSFPSATSDWQNVVSLGTNWSSGQTFSTTISGLLSGSTYVYRCYATNTTGEAWSSTQHFTAVYLPAVTNLGAVNGRTSSWLQGQVTDMGGGGNQPPQTWFRYWQSGGAVTTTVAMGPQSGVFSNAVAGLTPFVTYQYQVMASNAAGAVWSTVSSFASLATAWYVATNGNNSAGTNWVTAYTSLQTALDAAQMNDTIWIAGQTFSIVGQVNWTNRLASSLTVRGGYAANQNDPALPGSNSPSLWPTVIQRQSNNIRILNVAGITNGVLDQVTLTGGFVEGGGGGLSIGTSTNFIVSACVITNNLAGATASGSGGGVYVLNSDVILTNCVIRSNTSRGSGNSHGYGGGIYLNGGRINCMDSQVSFNECSAGGGNGRSNYGGILVGAGAMLLKNCLLLGNKVSGSISQLGNFYGNLQMVNCTVAGNIYGGIRGTTASLTNCIVWNNTDDIIGGTTLAYCNISDGDSNEVNGCISADPMFEYGFYLPAGSPSVNTGTGIAADWGLGSPYTTRTDGSPDSGNVDMGYHYPAGRDPVANADLYVSANSGDDGFAGTNATAPFKTITKALAQAGDVRRIHVASGNYTNGMETFPLSISNRQSIELLGTNSASTIISAQGIVARVFYLDSVPKAKLAGLTITRGNATGGGGIFVGNGGDVSLSSCAVTRNEGGTGGGGIYALNSYLTVTDSLLTSNTANGAVNASGSGGAILIGANSRITVSNCVLQANSVHGQNNGGAGGFGGGIYNGATLTLVQSVLVSNTVNSTHATKQGGGIYNAGVATLRNCLISTNRSTAAVTKGDGIYSTGTLTLQNCTVVNNWGEGLRAGGTASVSDSVFWGNGVDMVGGVTLSYCNTQQGTNNIENNCISADPAFADNTYFHERSRAGFYENGYFSGGNWSTNSTITNNPTLDAGALNSAWANEPQPNGRRVNLGAYGNTPIASKTFLEEPGEFTALSVHSYPPANVGPNSGTLSGEVLNDGGAGNPDAYMLWDSRADQGSSNTGLWQHVAHMGQLPPWQFFSTNLTGLSGTTYYRCFVTNNAGSDWSDLQSFGTAAAPEVSNDGAFPVYRRSATLMGTITDIGGDAPYVWFHYWINGDPATNTVSLPGTQSGAFNSTVTGLQAGSEYQYQILASNSAGVAWSGVSSFTTIASPVAWYAATNGTGLAGTNWSTAFPTLQAALDIAEDNDTIYLAGHVFPIATGLTWTARSNMTIRGGFAAANDATLPGARDAALWPSVLKWVAGVPDHRILTVTGITNSLVDGIAFRDGTLTEVAGGRFGAGLFISGSTGLTISACLITNNVSQGTLGPQGGGIFSTTSWLTLTNCVLAGNRVAGTGNTTAVGGGIFLSSGGMLVVDSVIHGCEANGANDGHGYGGGIHVQGGSLELRRSVLRGNKASANRGGFYGFGGGLNSGGTVVIQNSLIVTNNSTTDTGDGINSGGTLTADGLTLAYNQGVGLRVVSGTAAVTNAIFWGNGDDLTGTVSVAYSDIGTADAFWTNEVNGCISADPLFVDTTYYHLQSKNGHYVGGYFSGGAWSSSLNNSPCIDTGYPDPSDPWRGIEPEPNGRRSNMGAYGNTTVASKGATPGGTIFSIR